MKEKDKFNAGNGMKWDSAVWMPVRGCNHEGEEAELNTADAVQKNLHRVNSELEKQKQISDLMKWRKMRSCGCYYDYMEHIAKRYRKPETNAGTESNAQGGSHDAI